MLQRMWLRGNAQLLLPLFFYVLWIHTSEPNDIHIREIEKNSVKDDMSRVFVWKDSTVRWLPSDRWRYDKRKKVMLYSKGQLYCVVYRG